MTVHRYDTYKITDKVIKLDTGFLKVPVFATRTGVFNYRKSDGSIRRELRHPDEVFKADSLNTLSGVPFTNRHPSELVNSKNVRKYMVGMVSDNVNHDEQFVKTSVTIMDDKMVAEVEQNGLREVSCGYKCDVVEEAGEFEGERYDAVQTNIRYNHLAGVQKGRAGSEVRLRMDADDAELVEDGKSVPDHSDNLNGGKTMIVKIDGVQFDLTDNSLASAITQALEKRDSALAAVKVEFETVKTDSKKELDGLQAKHDQLKDENDKMKKDAEDAPKVAELVKARVSLVEAAKPHLDKEAVEKLDDLDDRGVKVAVIKSKVEKFDDKDRSDDYINARYDGIIESDTPAEKPKPATTKLDTALGKLDSSRGDGEEKTSEQVRADNMKADESAWQQPLGSYSKSLAASGGN